MAIDREQIKKQALADFAEYVGPMKARTMKSAGLDIIEGRREGASIWDLTGKKYIDCQTGSGIMNVGPAQPGNRPGTQGGPGHL